MFTRTFYAAQTFIILSIFAATHVASAQSYHRSIHHIETAGDIVDSSEGSHLQVNILPADKENLKFSVAVLNPEGKRMIISIFKGEDLLFFQNVRGEEYYNTFNFKELEDGDYKVIINDKKEKIVKEIHLETMTTSNRLVSIH